jgi:hypothetical protein
MASPLATELWAMLMDRLGAVPTRTNSNGAFVVQFKGINIRHSTMCLPVCHYLLAQFSDFNPTTLPMSF